MTNIKTDSNNDLTIDYSRKGVALYIKALDETVQPFVDAERSEITDKEAQEAMKKFLDSIPEDELEDSILALTKAIKGMQILAQVILMELISKAVIAGMD